MYIDTLKFICIWYFFLPLLHSPFPYPISTHQSVLFSSSSFFPKYFGMELHLEINCSLMFYYGWILCAWFRGVSEEPGLGQGTHHVGDGSEVSTCTHVHTSPQYNVYHDVRRVLWVLGKIVLTSDRSGDKRLHKDCIWAQPCIK